jgi:RHH-type proline utilization regulon transcriptional repressor/proline dehydrogenase/delta 1-pyrroline-5-carboxylate dehydrogenase
MAWFRRSTTTAAHERVSRSTPVTNSPEVRAIGEELLLRAREAQAGMFSAKFWSDALVNWAMKDEKFKVQLFRFIDCFPVLKDSDQVYSHLKDYLTQPGVTLPPGLSTGLAAGGLLKGTLTSTVTSQVKTMASQFIAGTDAADALPKLRKLWDQGASFTVDLLGEACLSDEEATAYQQRYADLITSLPKAVADWPAQPGLESDHLGPIPRVNVSIKISSLYARTNPIDFEGSLAGLEAALAPLLRAAGESNVTINFDMEQFALKDLTLALFMRCCEKYDFPAGLALQAYLVSAEDDAQRLIDWSKRIGKQVTVRLIKGAYWDFETVHAEQMGWPCPVWPIKSQTDACFERVTRQLVNAIPRTKTEGGIKLALGSHNARSIAHALSCVRQAGLPDNALELQMLRGMADDLKAGARAMNLRLREYVPVGELVPGMAYFVRRLLENTSNESWLRAAGANDGGPATALLADPAAAPAPTNGHVDPAIRHALSARVPGLGDGKPFYTEPMRDLADSVQRNAFARAIGASTLAAAPKDVSVADASRAVEIAAGAFAAWRDKAPRDRSAMLIKAADLMRQRRDVLAATLIKEAGKTWVEADADVCEAIDFCEYYARESVGLFERKRLGRFVGELDETTYEPRGVCVVISPWNFPLAILCGMTVAALSTGNTAVVKPAEQTPVIASIMCDLLWQAGIPRDVLHLATGPGETVGAGLVRDPRVAVIAFTGSKAVGMDILAAAGSTPDDQPFVKRVVCEMGGKNAIIVDDSADLDEAVLGVRSSAFGFAGQKCSACSRVIVLESTHDIFVHRLVESTRMLKVGDPTLPGTDIGPVIDNEAKQKILSYVQLGKTEGKLEVGLEVDAALEAKLGRAFVGPHIFSGIRPEHRLAKEEIFGPVLAVIKAKDFDEALAIANGTHYKLTGGLFSRKPSHIDRVKREYRVGNLYINRGITGALVGRQPFGGFGWSGVGSKAGGADYLLQFVEPRAICENTMRRGFAATE